MDETHLLAAIRYVARNPVRARLVVRARDWRWSNVHALLDPGRGDGLTGTAPALARVPNIANWLETGDDDGMHIALRRAETTGCPVGSDAFLTHVKNHPWPRSEARQAGTKNQK